MSIAGVIGGLKFLPASLGVKALQKVNPKFKNYFANAAAYGIDANRALDFIVERFESQSQRDYKDQLQKGASSNTLRPDEQVSRSNIRNAEMPLNALKGAASIGIGAALGGVGGAAAEGINQLSQTGQGQQPNEQAQSIDPLQYLSQYDQGLAQTFQQYIQNGQPPDAIAAILKNSSNWSKLIKSIEGKENMNFVDLIKKLFGQSGAQGPKGSLQNQVQTGTQPQNSGTNTQVEQLNQILAALRKR